MQNLLDQDFERMKQKSHREATTRKPNLIGQLFELKQTLTSLCSVRTVFHTHIIQLSLVILVS